jgi:hypothetical protein
MKTLDQLTQFHKGGGGGGAGPASQTISSTPPPPTTQSVEVQMAQRDAAKQAAKRRGINQTILAGETGGYKPTVGPTLLSGASTPDQRKSTLLGGV